MMVDVDARYFAGARGEDAISPYIRLHTDRDELYEMRDLGDASVRVYGADDTWQAKVRFPAGDVDEAYERFDAVAERVEDAYGEDLIVPSPAFLDELEEDGAVTAETADISIVYREEDGRDLAEDIERFDAADAIPAINKTVFGGYAGSGAAAGAAFGTVFPPFGPVVGGAVGGVLTGLVGHQTEAYLYQKESGFSPLRRLEQGVNRVRERRERRRQERTLAEENVQDMTLLETVNEKHRLEAVADTTRDLDEGRRYRELRDSDVDRTVETLLTHHFTDFDEQGGVITAATRDTYEDATAFAARAATGSREDAERPSILQDRDLFATVYEAADGERQEELINTVLSRDAAEAVRRYLDRNDPETVRRVGGRERLEAGGEGCGR